MNVGEYMLDKITSMSLFRIEREGENHIIVWSSGAAEQLEAMARAAMAQEKLVGCKCCGAPIDPRFEYCLGCSGENER